MNNRHQVTPEVFLFLIRDAKILLIRRCNTSYENGKYCFPAGHGEANETMREGVCREAVEEIGITVQPDQTKFAHTQHRFSDYDPKHPHARVGFYFTVTDYTGDAHNAEPHKCDQVDWFPLDKLPDTLIAHQRAALEAYLAGHAYSEFHWDARQPFVG
jgi:8-oxo-dGTP pyrophosphatase MutT (NUDIX family)